jgi:hypothetical protein
VERLHQDLRIEIGHEIRCIRRNRPGIGEKAIPSIGLPKGFGRRVKLPPSLILTVRRRDPVRKGGADRAKQFCLVVRREGLPSIGIARQRKLAERGGLCHAPESPAAPTWIPHPPAPVAAPQRSSPSPSAPAICSSWSGNSSSGDSKSGLELARLSANNGAS